MTAAALTPSKEYIENGVTLAYAVPFRFRAATHIKAQRISTAGVVTELAYGTDYSVTGGETDAGGTLTVSVAGAAGTRLRIRRETPRAQDMDYTTGDNFPAESHEAALDKAILIDQEQDQKIDDTAARALLFPDGEKAGLLPSIAGAVGKFLSRTVAGEWFWSSGTGSDPALRSELASGLLGTLLVAWRATGIGALTRSLFDRIADEGINAKDFGFSTTATAAENLAALKAAYAATPTNGRLHIPWSLNNYIVDTTGGLSEAVLIDRPVEIRMNGKLKANFGARQSNPPAIFKIASDDVTVRGGGVFIGDGTIDDVNAGTDLQMPSLLWVEGDRFSLEGVRFQNGPKTCIMLYGSHDAKLIGNTFTGGPTSYSDTAYFHVRAAGGGRHTFAHNYSLPAADGGMAVQSFFGSNCSNNLFQGNYAHKPYEKLIYWNGDDNLSIGDICIGNEGIIPGTNRQGTITPPFRFDGKNNKVVVAKVNWAAGLASMRFGGGNEVVACTGRNLGQGGIAWFDGSEPFSYGKINGNKLIAGNLQGVVKTDGIYVVTAQGPSVMLDIEHNIVHGFSPSDPLANVPVWQPGTNYPKYSVVKPSVGNGRYYEPQSAGGISGVAEPIWPATPGQTVNDNGIVWVAVAFETGTTAQIRVIGSSDAGEEFKSLKVNMNNIGGGQRGIVLEQVDGGDVVYNRIDAAVDAMKEINCANIRWDHNDVSGGAALTVVGMSSTSRLLSHFIGSYVPAQGSNLTVSGTFSASGTYTVSDGYCDVHVNLDATVGLKMLAPGELTHLPIPATANATGVAYNTNLVSPATLLVMPSINATRVYCSIINDAGFPNGVSSIIFSLRYKI